MVLTSPLLGDHTWIYRWLDWLSSFGFQVFLIVYQIIENLESFHERFSNRDVEQLLLNQRTTSLEHGGQHSARMNHFCNQCFFESFEKGCRLPSTVEAQAPFMYQGRRTRWTLRRVSLELYQVFFFGFRSADPLSEADKPNLLRRPSFLAWHRLRGTRSLFRE